jgi:hypothetical protein
MADTEVHVVWDDAAAKLFCEADGGPVARAMSQLADGLVLSMKYHCPVSPVDSGRSGTLRSSITKFRQPDGSYLVGPTALTDGGQLLGPLLEDGTPPHPIDSHGPWPLRSKSGQVFGRHVNHPGTRAQPFIAPAARELNGVVLPII